MKINYTFANGETSEIDVSEEIGNVILDSRREESNLDRKERYHCYSLDAAEFEGADYADVATPEGRGGVGGGESADDAVCAWCAGTV